MRRRPSLWWTMYEWNHHCIGSDFACSDVVVFFAQTKPVVVPPPNVTLECSQPTSPAQTGTANVTDNCDAAPTVSYNDTVIPGSCPSNYVIIRDWVAIDACGNFISATQQITVRALSGFQTARYLTPCRCSGARHHSACSDGPSEHHDRLHRVSGSELHWPCDRG
jgi:hypothetical protein